MTDKLKGLADLYQRLGPSAGAIERPREPYTNAQSLLIIFHTHR
jgi:hypothetical protein